MSEHACPYTHIYKRKLNAIKLILFINASCSVKKNKRLSIALTRLEMLEVAVDS